jgi:hypothetical protein
MNTPLGSSWLQARVRQIFGAPWVWGTARVAVFLGTVNLIFVAVTISSARGAAETAARRAGELLMDQLGPSIIGDSQGVLINGQRLFIAAKSTRLPVEQVLAMFEKHCRDGAREWHEEMESLPTATARALPAKLRDITNAMTLRVEPDGRSPGEIACIVPNGEMQGIAGLVHRFSEFAVKGDLSKIGEGRFAMVRRNEKTGVSLVVAVWTEGPFEMASMFPEHGDAPGRDSPYAPRPLDAIRLASAEIEDRPYAVRTYETPRSRAEILSRYATEMSARGWTAQPMAKAPGFDLNGNVGAFEEDGTAVIVTARDAAGGRTDVSILEMGSTGFVHTAESGAR